MWGKTNFKTIHFIFSIEIINIYYQPDKAHESVMLNYLCPMVCHASLSACVGHNGTALLPRCANKSA